ncbi:MAG: hypothetical protein ACOZE5_12790 [Verrucomicrobiota bacterium]
MFPASVPRLRPLIALLLTALWLPATLHCRLEAASFYEADECCADEQTANTSDCKDDACPTVEDALYKESSQDLKIAAPATCVCFVCLAPVTADETVAEPALSPARHAPPPELGVTWQFVARAAPPVRAPALSS